MLTNENLIYVSTKKWMGKGCNLAPLKYQKAKFNLAPMNQKWAKVYLRASIYPSERVNGKVNRVNHPSKGI